MLIPTHENTKTVTDMREDASSLLADVSRLGLVYVLQHNSPRAVMLSIDEFLRLQELAEDYFDEQEAIKLVKEDRGEGIPLNKVTAKYLK